MKTVLLPSESPRGTPVRTAVVIAASFASLLFGEDATPSSLPKVSSNEYQLFTGLDLSAEHDGKVLPVVDVVGERFYLKKERDVKQVPFWKVKAYRMEPVLKLSDFAVDVTDFKATPDYMPETDPRIKWNRSANQMFIAQADRSMDQQSVVNVTPNVVPTVGPPGQPGSGGPTLQSQAIQKMERAMQSDRASADLRDGGWYAGRMQEELNQELYDALVFDFTLASKTYIPDPYIVIITTGRAPDQPDKEFDSIYARSLESIGNGKLRHFHVRQGGLPPGYKLARTQFHLYSGKQEIATSLSEKRMTLSKEQATEYLVVQYMVDHKTDTVAAKPALTAFPPDFSSRIMPEQLKNRFVLTISPAGKVIKVALHDDANVPVDPYVENVIKSFHFYPALLKGKPVEGQIRARFSDLQ